MAGVSEHDPRRTWTLDCGSRYWPAGRQHIDALPIPRVSGDPGAAQVLRRVALPDWAAELGVDGCLLAFDCVIAQLDGRPDWQRCDWIANAYHLLAGSAERAHEQAHGPALSYAFRLPRALDPVFERAWVNRIFLFLRRWAAREGSLPEQTVFGPLPKARIGLTHDVDALRLTPEIRFKQSAFQLANAARALAQGQGSRGAERLSDAWRYAASAGDFRTFDRIRAMERAAGLRSTLHFYGGPPGLSRGTPRRILIDPAYDISSDAVRAELRMFADGGWTVGLHQSFDAWQDAGAMVREKSRVERALGAEVRHCRQHWLHFSWEKTWAAQAAAGLATDSTLGFNDRPGFRAGHALRHRPWDTRKAAPLSLDAVPMVLMDSHFYDYAGAAQTDVAARIKPWIDEVRAVGGEATVNWHTHTITDVYGWGAGFEALLGVLT